MPLKNKIGSRVPDRILTRFYHFASFFSIDVGVFMDEWARQGGHARFQMEFFYNR